MSKEDLAAKWIETAKKDLIHDDFNDYLPVNRGLQKLMDFNKEITLDTFRAQVCLLNASLVHQYTDCRAFFEMSRAQQSLARLDYIIYESKKLPASQELQDLLIHAKTCYYYRLGDLHMASLIRTQSDTNDQTLLTNALCSYALALYHATRRQGEFDQSSSVECLNIMELHLLLTSNLKFIGGQKALKDALNNENLLSKLTQIILSNKKEIGYILEEKSINRFVNEDIPGSLSSFSLPTVQYQKLLTTIWGARRHNNFLKRFLWLMYNSSGSKKDAFLDQVLAKIPLVPKKLNINYTSADFTLIDLKIMIYRLGDQFVRSFTNSLEKNVILPSHFHDAVSPPANRLWKIVSTICDIHPQKLQNTSDEIHFVTSLEEIRMDVHYDTAKGNLINAIVFIFTKIVELEDKNRPAVIELFERYYKYTLQILKNQCPSKPNSPLFPPHLRKTSKIQDDEALEHQIKVKMAQLALLKKDMSTAEEVLMNVKDKFKDADETLELQRQVYQIKAKSGLNLSMSAQKLSPNTSLDKSSWDDSFQTAHSSAGSRTPNTTLDESGHNKTLNQTPKNPDESVCCHCKTNTTQAEPSPSKAAAAEAAEALNKTLKKKKDRDDELCKKALGVLDKYAIIAEHQLKELNLQAELSKPSNP